jgi:hypothetical protein
MPMYGRGGGVVIVEGRSVMEAVCVHSVCVCVLCVKGWGGVKTTPMVCSR